MTTDTSTPLKGYRLDQLPGLMPREVREYLRKIGHKIGNPSPRTTSFKLRKGWTTQVIEDCAVIYDPAGHVRLRYYPEAKVARVGRDENWRDAPLGTIRTQPWMEIIPRYEICSFGDGFCAYDHKVGDWYGELHETREGVAKELDERRPNWQDGWHWDDEVPETWWSRLLFWRRNG